MTGSRPLPSADTAAARASRLARLGAICIASVAVAAAARIVLHDRSHREDAASRLTAELERAGTGLVAWEQSALARARAWAADPGIEAVRPDGTTTLAQAVRTATPEGVRAAAFFAPDGALISSTAPTLLTDATIGIRTAAVRRAGGGTASVGGPVRTARDRASKAEWLVVAAVPVRDAEGAVTKVLALFHDADAPLRATRLLGGTDAGREVYLVDDEGERVSSIGPVTVPTIRGPVVSVARSAPAPDEVGRSASGVRTRPYAGAAGRRVYGAWGAASPLGGRVVHEIDAAAISGRAGPLDVLLAALLVAAAILAFWLSAVMRDAFARGGRNHTEAGALVDSAPHAILVVDAGGRVTRANARAALLLDASVLGLVGSKAEQWLRAGAPLRGERVGAWLEQAARSGTARRADGREVAVEVRVGQGELAGEPLFVVALLDRSEQQAAKQELQEARQDAAVARQRQDELVQTVNEGIRSPMSRVVGMAHLLRDSQLSEVQRGYVDSMMRSAQSMLTFVTDVLDLAKAEHGTLQLIEAPLEVRGLLEEIGAHFATQAEANRVGLEVRVTERTPIRVMGDIGRLRQVLITLVGNGIRFAAGGRVSLAADGEPNGQQVRLHLTISDTGPGMDAETTRRLLAPDPTTVSKLAGGGLGLAMAKHLVERMGGKLRVTSLQGEGSTFAFTLVLRASQRAGDAASSGSPVVKLRGARALVVDGSPQPDGAAGEWMRSWGMRVETSSTAEDALGRLKQAAAEGDPIELALIDRQSLGEAADALARRLRADRAIAGTGLLVATDAASAASDAALLAFAGADAVVAKPVAAAALSRTLAAVAERPRAERGSGMLIAGGPELSLVRGPVEHADGHIPVIDETAGARRPDPAPADDSRLRVLLAEDNRVNQIVATNLLQRLGCRVEVVGDGTEAVRVASRHEFDVVLMDILMPTLDGIGATQLIRRLPAPFHAPHIIAMGTSASPEERDRYLAAGMNDVIAKPLTPEAVQSALERRPAGLERRGGAPVTPPMKAAG